MIACDVMKLPSRAYLRTALSQPLPARDRGAPLQTIEDVVDYMAALPREREMRAYWQCAAGSILDQAAVAEVSRRIQLALFFDGKLDLTRIEPAVSAMHKVRRRSGGEGVRRVRLWSQGCRLLRQAAELEGRAADATNANLKAGFLDLAKMCRDLAAQMQRQLELLKQRSGS